MMGVLLPGLGYFGRMPMDEFDLPPEEGNYQKGRAGRSEVVNPGRRVRHGGMDDPTVMGGPAPFSTRRIRLTPIHRFPRS